MPDMRCKDMKKIGIFFPGLGYSAERPLLYYTKKMLMSYGYEILELDYADRMDESITKEIRDNLLNPDTVKSAVLKYVEVAFKYVEEQLGKKNPQISDDDRVVLVSKSIGSVVDAVYSAKHGINGEHILFTPLSHAFQLIKDIDGLAFSGTSDPVANAAVIRKLCMGHDIVFHSVEGGNHSLETGDVIKDISNLSWVMDNVDSYISGLSTFGC